MDAHTTTILFTLVPGEVKHSITFSTPVSHNGTRCKGKVIKLKNAALKQRCKCCSISQTFMEITEKYDWNLTFKAKGLQQVDREKLIVTDDRVTRGHVKERREKKL